MRQKVMTFVNTYVRGGSNFPASGKMATALVQYLNEWYQKEIDKKKSEKGKETWKAKRDEMVNKINELLDDEELIQAMSEKQEAISPSKSQTL